MKYRLLTISILSGIFLSSQDALAARYIVNEVTPSEEYRHHFAQGLSDNGELLGVTRDSFNFSYYLEDYLSVLAGNGTPCGVFEDEIASGDFDAFSSACIKVALGQNDNSELFQKIGDSKSFINTADSANILHLVDFFDPEINSYTDSNFEALRAMNSQGIAVGQVTGAYSTIFHRPTGEDVDDSEEIKMWQRDYKRRAVVYTTSNERVRLIEPEYNLYGGVTDAIDVSNAGYVAGHTSVSMSQSLIDSIEENCDGGLRPESVCIWQQTYADGSYQVRPVVWTLDANGNVEASEVYDLAIEPESGITTGLTASMTSVNDSGTAVGFGHVFRGNTEEQLLTMPLLYQDSETLEFIDNEAYDGGFATSINNEGTIVGTLQTFQNGTFNEQFFIYTPGSEQLETPETFYVEAESTAYDINDEGRIVGVAEYEITTDDVRREHGFLYDSVTRELFDLNDLIECNSEFEIVEARAINNSDQIAATALKRVDRRDALGQPIVDSVTGEIEKEQVAVAVLLEPTNGQIDDCSAIDLESDDRKGALTSIWLSLSLLGLAVFRRRIF